VRPSAGTLVDSSPRSTAAVPEQYSIKIGDVFGSVLRSRSISVRLPGSSLLKISAPAPTPTFLPYMFKRKNSTLFQVSTNFLIFLKEKVLKVNSIYVKILFFELSGLVQFYMILTTVPGAGATPKNIGPCSCFSKMLRLHLTFTA
jgi:hypothetical protein